jgi:hypothetical protein
MTDGYRQPVALTGPEESVEFKLNAPNGQALHFGPHGLIIYTGTELQARRVDENDPKGENCPTESRAEAILSEPSSAVRNSDSELSNVTLAKSECRPLFEASCRQFNTLLMLYT